MKFKNTQNINKIIIKDTSKNFCPIGNDWYTNQFTITFIPKEYICDYLDVERFIKDEINNKHLIIEDAVDVLFEYMNNEYSPKYLKISSHVDDAIHCEVVVDKESSNDE